MSAKGTALAKLEARQKIANAARRARERASEHRLLRHGAALSTGAALGTLAKMGVSNTIGGVPWKPALALLALVGEGMTRGATQAACAGIASGIGAVYAERTIATGTYVAGEGGDI